MNTEQTPLQSGRDFSFVVINETMLRLEALPYAPELEEFLSVRVSRDPSGRGLAPQVVAVYTPENCAFAFNHDERILHVPGADFRNGDQIVVLLTRRPLPGAMRVINHAVLNAELHRRSGEVVINSKLVGFLYTLLRDHLTPGVVEELVREVTAHDSSGSYCNGYLARYAEDVAKRLVDQPVQERTE